MTEREFRSAITAFRDRYGRAGLTFMADQLGVQVDAVESWDDHFRPCPSIATHVLELCAAVGAVDSVLTDPVLHDCGLAALQALCDLVGADIGISADEMVAARTSVILWATAAMLRRVSWGRITHTVDEYVASPQFWQVLQHHTGKVVVVPAVSYEVPRDYTDLVTTPLLRAHHARVWAAHYVCVPGARPDPRAVTLQAYTPYESA